LKKGKSLMTPSRLGSSEEIRKGGGMKREAESPPSFGGIIRRNQKRTKPRKSMYEACKDQEKGARTSIVIPEARKR